MSEVVEIIALNKRGEGVTEASCGAITVPFTLPGEKVEVELVPAARDKTWGQITRILNTSKSRVEPICQHFGVCGGCALQHLDEQAYLEFKKNQVVNPLVAAGFDASIVSDPILIGPHQRRRIDFLTRKFPDGMNMGFYQVNSRRRINLKSCAIVDPQIEALFPKLEALLEELLQMKELVHIFILAADNGIDLLLAGFKRDLTEPELQLLKTFGSDHNLARLTYKIKRKATVIYEREPPYVTFAGHRIEVNPNVFLQASSKADGILSSLVVEAIPSNAKRVVDLFCGRGTLTLPLAEKGLAVKGFEGDKHAIAALQALNISAEVRDLFENPLSSDELREFDAVVMNPPRSGVKRQVGAIIEARIPTVVYVSCNPETFAADMEELCANGYKLESVTPVDQFTWSHHVEVVGVATAL